jgi:hypothetical protein
MNDGRRYLANGVAVGLIVLTAAGILGHSAMSVAASAPADGPVAQALDPGQGQPQAQALDPDTRRRLRRLLGQLGQQPNPAATPAATPTTSNSNGNGNGNGNDNFDNFNDNVSSLLERATELAASRAASSSAPLAPATGVSSLDNGPTTSSPDSLVQLTVDNPDVVPQLSYDIPPGPADTSVPSAFRVIRQFMVITTPPDKPAIAKLVLRYADTDVGPGGPFELQVRYYRASLGTWLSVPSTVDPTAHTVTVRALFVSVIEQPIHVALLAPQ